MEWNHFDENGNAVMVDVSEKEITERIAVASGKIRVNDAVMSAIVNHTAKKGDVLIKALCTVKVSGKTGVEMEALMGVNVALLTIYDMCKAMDRAMEIFDVHLEKKDGGKSGLFERSKEREQC